jgi:hypothetical protein
MLTGRLKKAYSEWYKKQRGTCGTEKSKREKVI